MKLGFLSSILPEFSFEGSLILRLNMDLPAWNWHAGLQEKQKDVMPE